MKHTTRLRSGLWSGLWRWTQSRGLSGRAIALVLVMGMVVSLSLAGTSPSVLAAHPQPVTFETMTLPDGARSLNLDRSLMQAGTKHPVLANSLSALAVVAPDQAIAAAQSQGFYLLNGRVQVQIAVQPGQLDTVDAAVTGAGGEVTGASGDQALIQAWLPAQSLETLAGHPAIYRIQPPVVQSLTQGAVSSEGLAPLNASAWHAVGQRGAGIKIGIIDSGFLDYPSLLGSELPATVTVGNFVDFETEAEVNGTTKHGTACAELIHDVAPAAQLFLAKVRTSIDFEEAVDWLVNTHKVDIISHSGGFFAVSPGDGTGHLADVIAQARSAGVLWVNAAGNERTAHWGGAFSDPDDDDIHDFADAQEVNFFGPGAGNPYLIPAGYIVTGFLRWDDWSAVDQDYDLLLVRWNGTGWDIIAESIAPQDGGPGQRPVEVVQALSFGPSTAYGFAIMRYDATRDVHFEFFAPKVESLDQQVPGRSIVHPADVPAALTVGALEHVAPFVQESFSSEGPTNGPGGSGSGGTIKPDLGAYDGVTTLAIDPFFGTSAAAPHVAGAAALVASAFPSFGPDQVQDFLEERAIDLGAPGQDNVYGWGRVNLGAPPVTCYTLSLRHAGQGSDPVAAPANSNGCSAGQYAAGASITLSATPADQWYIDSWTGTDNDHSTNLTNHLTMPAANHTVMVAYTDTLQTAEVWGRAFIDANRNSQFDQGETVVEGVNLRLVDTGLNATGLDPMTADYQVTAITDADGVFRWEEVPHNAYYLTIDPPSDYVVRGAEIRVVIVNEGFRPPILISVVDRLPGMTAHLPLMR